MKHGAILHATDSNRAGKTCQRGCAQSLQLGVIDGDPYKFWPYRCEIKTMTHKTIHTTYGLQRP